MASAKTKPEPGRPLTRIKWLDTPYAKSKAGDSDRDIARLLDKYDIHTRQWTEHPGAGGRPAVTLRFQLHGRTYRFGFETLDTDQRVTRAERLTQIKRLMFWHLKTVLEDLLVFMPPEQALLPYLEGNDGVTVYEATVPHLDKLDTRRQIAAWGNQKALPPPAAGGSHAD